MTTVTRPQSTEKPEKAAKPERTRGIGGALRWFAMTFGLLIILLGAWQISALINPSTFIPSPAQIGTYFVKMFFLGGVGNLTPADAWLGQALPTIGRALLGLALGAVMGVLIGVATGLNRVFRYSTSWVLEFLRAVPPSAVLPLFIVMLGGEDWMRVAFIAYAVSLYVLINTANGVSSVDPTLIMMGRSFRLTGPQIVWRIVLPAAQPQIWAGLRIATIGATILAIVSEFFNAVNGIGYQIQWNVGRFNMQGMWAWILLLALFGLALNLTIEGVERRVLRWHRNSH